MLAILARVRRVGSSQAAMPGLVYHSHGIEVDYTVDNKAALGEGGFGQVCKAVHNATKQERACKRIQKKDVKDKKAFEREVELQKAMDHPNICRLYDVYQDAKVAESGRPSRAQLLAKEGCIVGGVGCPPNCRTSGKPWGSSHPLELF